MSYSVWRVFTKPALLLTIVPLISYTEIDIELRWKRMFIRSELCTNIRLERNHSANISFDQHFDPQTHFSILYWRSYRFIDNPSSIFIFLLAVIFYINITIHWRPSRITFLWNSKPQFLFKNPHTLNWHSLNRHISTCIIRKLHVIAYCKYKHYLLLIN